MKSMILIASFFMFCMLESMGQGFNNRYDFMNFHNGEGVWDIELVDDGYLLFQTGDDSMDVLVTISTRKLGFSGELLDEKQFVLDNTYIYSGWSNTGSPTSDGNFILGGGWNRGFSMANLVLHDSEGDTIWMRRFGNPIDSVFHTGRAAIEAVNGDFLMVGEGYENASSDTAKGFIVRTDHDGNEIWRKYIGDGLSNGFLSIANALDGGFLVSGSILYSGWNKNMWVVRISQDGQVLWQEEYGEQGFRDTGAHLSIGNISDTFLVSGGSSIFSQSDSFDSYPYITKIDGAGNIIWENTFGDHEFDTGIISIKPATDGGYIGAGLSLSTEFGGYIGFLVRIAENGDSLWRRNYQWVEGNHSFFRDVINSENGGFVACGLVYSNPELDLSLDSWVVKTDEYGCVVPGCQVSILENEQQVNFLTYPNPVESTLNIYFESTVDPEGRFVLTDTNSREIHSFEVRYNLTTYAIDLSFLESGMYHLVYMDSKQTITRSIVKL